jgi:hypothetical protein
MTPELSKGSRAIADEPTATAEVPSGGHLPPWVCLVLCSIRILRGEDMRQAMLVITALMACGCISNRQPQPVSPKTATTDADSLRAALKAPVLDSLALRQLQDTSLRKLARELLRKP